MILYLYNPDNFVGKNVVATRYYYENETIKGTLLKIGSDFFVENETCIFLVNQKNIKLDENN